MGQANGLITLLRIIVTLPIAIIGEYMMRRRIERIISGAWDTPDYLE